MNGRPRQADLFVLFLKKTPLEHKPTITLPPENKRSAYKDFCIKTPRSLGWLMIQFDERADFSKNCGKKTTKQLYQCWNQGEEISPKIGLTTRMVLQAAKRLENFMLWKLLASFLLYLGRIPNCNKRRSEQLEFSSEQKLVQWMFDLGKTGSFKHVAEWF